MNQSLPFLPGYSFRDPTKTRFVFPRTLVYSKGVPVPKPIASTTAKAAAELLEAQNKIPDTEFLATLTYGPKRTTPKEVSLPRYLAMDKKVLRFMGYIRDDMEDIWGEKYRIRPVKVLYYLQNDTMEVIEPKTENSGLFQGTLFKRQKFPHPDGKGRLYLWKDLNLGNTVRVYGVTIHLTDCDQWTREYLINAGIELHEAEPMPSDPHTEERRAMEGRKEVVSCKVEDDKLYKFLTRDRKVLRFYGTWQDILSDPPEMRRVILQYYLADDTMELLEDHPPNCGRDPVKVLVRKQKIPVDRNELSANFPLSYMEIKDEDLRWFQPDDFRTGKDVIILGKKIFLHDCDEFTRQYYKTHYGVEDMESIAVAEKPKPQPPTIFPPHTGIGTWDDSLQNCLHIIPKPVKKDLLKELHFDGITLRFKARLVSPIEDDKIRRFLITFFPSDDAVAINEESIPNSGFPGGCFLKRSKLPVLQGNASVKPVYYKADDFYVGAQIRASGKLFELIDADHFVLTFMEQHPELYSVEHIETHKKGVLPSKQKSESFQSLTYAPTKRTELI
ncbi:EF-hand domain-containing protein 1-like isoform X2 [Stegodyphus dumicola]|uniref:EF-hand domain-containing protein 1-like isoform X2 n=1 Tax=Stegodyphus dumicola TaxID=202533 RepID=UPI0015A96D62|nr:EF-hand domain-containing protein 1-like isoform X2 [Stegodyphus dumicola]